MDKNQNLKSSDVKRSNAVQKASPIFSEQNNLNQNQLLKDGINQATDDKPIMEAQHSHHAPNKKKWSEYLLEFFMLFLAVFLGFVAENIRENNVERQNEREYILGMVQNLKDDTTQFNQVIPVLTLRTEKIDSLIRLSKADFTIPENLKALTRIAMQYAAYYNTFKTNNATITQLKSGNLRLIQTGHVADSILKYDYLNSRSETQWQQSHLIYNNYITISEEVFDVTIMFDTSYMKNRQLLDKIPPQVTSDKEKLKLYFNKLSVDLISTRGYLRMLNTQAKYAKQLILFLKNEYHLNNE